MYQPVGPGRPVKKGVSKSYAALIGLLVFVFAFGLGYRAQDAGLFENVSNEANTELPKDLNYDSVEEVYDELRADFDGELKEEDLITGLKQGLAEASGDPYTSFFDLDQTERFYSDLNGSFEGIGAELGLDGDFVIVVAPISGFPAEEAGLRPQDIILEIDGEDAIGISTEEAVEKIRGEAGTEVILSIARDSERIEVPIIRATITIPSVNSELLADGTVGYLQVTRFADDTGQLSREAAQSFKEQGVESVILDLRSNSGGFVDAGVAVASLWLDNEVVFEQKAGGRSEGVFRAQGSPVLNGIETIVLINEGSASASEIVAGALKDNGAAQLVGQKSFGKGSVQQLAEFDDGSTLKVTVARWFTPNGINIDEDGIVPDQEVEFTEEDFENDTDSQRDRALEILAN